MRALRQLKVALAEFDCHRCAWAEIQANNAPPGRDSAMARRLEVMQGSALEMVDGCAMALRQRIRGDLQQPNPRQSDESERSP